VANDSALSGMTGHTLRGRPDERGQGVSKGAHRKSLTKRLSKIQHSLDIKRDREKRFRYALSIKKLKTNYSLTLRLSDLNDLVIEFTFYYAIFLVCGTITAGGNWNHVIPLIYPWNFFTS